MILSPKLFKPRRIGSGVSDCVLNVPVSKIVLDQARVCALVGQGEATSMAQHMRMHGQGQSGLLAVFTEKHKYGFPAQRPAPLTHEKGVRVGLHLGPIRKPRLDSPQLVGPQRVGGGQALFEAGDMQDAAFGVHLGENQPASLGHPQPMAEHEEQKAAVAGLVPCALGGGQELFEFGPNEVFSLICRFV